MNNPSARRIARRAFLHRAVKTAAIASVASATTTNLFAKAAKPLRAGVAKRKITPPLSIPYLTSSGNGTCKAFDGLHDDLYARALVLDDGKSAIALLAVDSIGYDNTILGPRRDFTHELRKRIAAQTSLRPEAIMLTATHAHSTPETIGLTDFRTVSGVSEWIEQHLRELAQTVVDAWHNRVAVRPSFEKTHVGGVARNRRIAVKGHKLSRYGPIPAADQIVAPWFVDEELSLLTFRTQDGKLHSTLMNYTAHPVVTMLLPQISADYPGVAAGAVEREFPGSVCLFTQGAAGNINSIYVSSKYEDAEALGNKLADAAVTSLKRRGETLLDAAINHRSTSLRLEPRSCPSIHDAERIAAAQPTPENLRTLRLARKLAEGALRAEIQLMSIGPVKWISLPGEPFVETGLALKQHGASFVCGYSNGWLGYFPIRRAYDEGGYEVDLGAWSRVAPGSAELLERAGLKALHSFA